MGEEPQQLLLPIQILGLGFWHLELSSEIVGLLSAVLGIFNQFVLVVHSIIDLREIFLDGLVRLGGGEEEESQSGKISDTLHL